jgi:hypothetical protein
MDRSYPIDEAALKRAFSSAQDAIRRGGSVPGASLSLPERALIEATGFVVSETQSAAKLQMKAIAELAKGVTSANATTRAVQGDIARLFGQRGPDPASYVVKAASYVLRAHWTGRAGRDGIVLNGIVRELVDADRPSYWTKRAVARLTGIERAASAPHTTTNTPELSQPSLADLILSLAPGSLYSQLTARGLRLSLTGISTINIPVRTPGTLAGEFTAEQNAKLAHAGAFTRTPLGPPHKLAIISAFTNELREHSTPTIESAVRQGMSEDTSDVLDAKLLDDVAASAARPAGLLFGVTPLTASAGNQGEALALINDISNLVAAIPKARDPVLVMNATDAVRALTVIPQLRLNILTTIALPEGTVVAIDAADFASAEGDEPQVELSENATLHLSDAPLPIGEPPDVLATPTLSMWQMDMTAVRHVLWCDWTMRRPGRVAVIEGVNW